MIYLGDFAEDATVYIPFNTFSSDDPSASVTITNLADADIKVHKDGGTTEATTDGATVAIDFDGITGNHLITVDTSADAFYAVGSDYMVRVEGTTVDGATVNAFVGIFSIENRYYGNDLSAAAVNAECDTAITDAALATAANLATVDTVVDGIQTDLDNGTDGLGALKTLIDTVDTVVDAIKAVTDVLPDSGALTSLATAAALTTVDTVADGIQTDLDNATDGLGALKTLIDALNDFDPTATTVDVGKINGVANAAASLALSAGTIVAGAAEATPTTTTMQTDLAEATDDHYNGRVLIWTSGVLQNQATAITDYTGSTGTLTFTAVTEAATASDTFVIV